MPTLTVGADKQFRTINAAVTAASSGDTVAIDAGTYTNDFSTITKPLTLEGVGGMAHLVATVAPPNGKALLVTRADTVIDNLEFSGVQNANKNGAGIRHELGDLTITDSYFHHNQDGILMGAASGAATDVVIRNSEFGFNGAGDGQSHGIYVGNVGHLTVDNSYFHDNHQGHEFKSRAAETTITNSRFQDEDGDPSYNIDLPNGGVADIRNSVIQQSPTSGNSAMVSFGAEGGLWGNSSLTMVDNVAIDDAGDRGRFLNNHTTITAQVSGTDTWGLSASDMIGRGPVNVTGTTQLSSRPALDEHSPVGSAAPAPAPAPTPAPEPAPEPTPAPTPAPSPSPAEPGKTLTGAGGNDNLVGGAGNDALSGTAGNDTLDGRAGDDRLEGGSGADTLIGGPGSDLLIGGSERDLFRFGPADGPQTDTLLGFGNGANSGAHDFIDLRGSGWTAADVHISQQDANVLIEFGETDLIIPNNTAANYSVGDDFLF